MLSFIDTPPSDGSSPRVRGQPSLAQFHCIQVRIIPARAGPTGPVGSHRIGRQDHPRACGANHRHMRSHPFPRGSSPRVRGQPPAYAISPVPSRIIPARAGPTTGICDLTRSLADHPRACGANHRHMRSHPFPRGSSPRVRGQPPAYAISPVPSRIIPARAGPTAWRTSPARSTTDHPRACGANEFVVDFPTLGVGSSPRVRGQHTGFDGEIHFERIIPARAGPTACPR